MKQAGSSSVLTLCFIGTLLLRIGAISEPAKGPTISTITSATATELTVVWSNLSANDANGNITSYTVCYQLTSGGSDVSCSNSETVDGADTTTVTLRGLNEATTYDVAVKATNKAGTGVLGTKKSGTTGEAKPAKGPTISTIMSPTATELTVVWSNLSANDANGNITSYTVCYQLTSGGSDVSCSNSETVDGADTTTVTLRGLNEATTYDVAVKATNKAGTGVLGTKKSGTTGEAKPAKGPTISTIMSPTATELTVVWSNLSANDANGNITSYTVCYQLTSGGSDVSCSNSETVDGADTTTVTLRGLNEATTYDVAVKATNKAGTGVLGTKKSGTTGEAKPAKGPTISTITSPTATELTVVWSNLSANDANGNITSYTVCYQLTSGGSDVSCSNSETVDGADTTTVTLRGLNEATTYDVAVKATNKAGTGVLGTKKSGTTGEAKPAKGPTISTITSPTATELTVVWSNLSANDANGNITSYTVCYQLTSGGSDVSCSNSETVDGADTTTVTLRGLNEATTYDVAVKATNKAGTGVLGTKKSGTTGEAKPAKGPTISTITSPTATELTVVWSNLSANDANGNITSYTVCYQLTSGGSDVSCSNSETVDGADTTTVTLRGLNEATTYDVAVKATNKAGTGVLGTKKSGTTGEAKPAKGPTISTITSPTATELTVVWSNLSANDANGNITSYTVCYQLTSGGSDVSCSNSETVDGADTTTVTLRGLNEATTYDVAVKATNKAGTGVLGTKKSGTTGEAKPGKGPTITEITSPTATELTVVWSNLSANDANGNITSYTVCYQLTSGGSDVSCSNSETVDGADTTTVTLRGLNEATTYDVAVKATNKAGTGVLGTKKSGTTGEATPDEGPNISSITSPKSTELRVVWSKLSPDDANGNITNYTVCYQVTRSGSDVSCTNSKTVNSADNTKVTLSGLNEATTYDVAIKATNAAGTGVLGTKTTNATLEDIPAKGPNISTITSPTSTKLTVVWLKLSDDDANGHITSYTVCYRLTSIGSNVSCTKNKTVNGADTTTVTLSGLNKATTYDVAVKAATVIGFGNLGTKMNGTTLEDIPGKPKITKVSPSFTSIEVSWKVPTDTNGEIVNYRVCSNNTHECQNVSSNERSTTITNFKPGVRYEVTVRAFTAVGGGNPSKKLTTTKKSGVNKEAVWKEDNTKLNIKKSETRISFTLPDLKDEEKKDVTSVQIIVQKWISDEDALTVKNSLVALTRSFKNSSGGNLPYVTLSKEYYENGYEVVIGDGKTYTSSARKRRSTTGTVAYENVALSDDTNYGIFLQVVYDQAFVISGVLRLKTKKEKTSSPIIIILVVILVIVVLLVIVFAVLIFRRRNLHHQLNDEIDLVPTVKIVRHPIPVPEFRAHCERLQQNTGLGYQEEYESIRARVPVSTETAKRPENIDKNRYNNIHAYDDTRVVLSQVDGVEGSDYINANFIDGFNHKDQFIAAQGTIKTTVVDFWRMVWEKGVTSIVMLANPVEKGKEKCAVYWPQDRSVKHGQFMIKLNGEVELADYVIRKMAVTMDDVKETRLVTQFHYTVWPDHGVPPYSTSLQAFLTRIRKTVKDDPKPVIVHCSAGVGRTGTFIGIFAMMDRMEETKTIDIYNFVCEMRGQRTYMVQVESQYVFLHKAVLETVECGDTEINAADLRLKMNMLNREDPDNPPQTLMAKQFKVLNKYTFSKKNTEEGTKSYNVDKNRSKEILPFEDTRVTILKSPGVDGSDYINASFIDSYQNRGMYIATQHPLENTVNDFWRMVWEKKSNCIVMLLDLEEEAGSYKYWTEKSNDAMLCGNLLVNLEQEEKMDEFVVRSFKLKKNDGGETRNISHFNFLSWSKTHVPKTTAGLRKMIGRIQDVQRQSGNNPIVIHCNDGGGRAGAFCALVTSLERVKQDSSFNLFQTIMLQRIQRPKMVTSLDQYKFCFQAILDFLDSFDDYANFQDLERK